MEYFASIIENFASVIENFASVIENFVGICHSNIPKKITFHCEYEIIIELAQS